jgi:hypothetical protein
MARYIGSCVTAGRLFEPPPLHPPTLSLYSRGYAQKMVGSLCRGVTPGHPAQHPSYIKPHKQRASAQHSCCHTHRHDLPHPSRGCIPEGCLHASECRASGDMSATHLHMEPCHRSSSQALQGLLQSVAVSMTPSARLYLSTSRVMSRICRPAQSRHRGRLAVMTEPPGGGTLTAAT